MLSSWLGFPGGLSLISLEWLVLFLFPNVTFLAGLMHLAFSEVRRRWSISVMPAELKPQLSSKPTPHWANGGHSVLVPFPLLTSGANLQGCTRHQSSCSPAHPFSAACLHYAAAAPLGTPSKQHRCWVTPSFPSFLQHTTHIFATNHNSEYSRLLELNFMQSLKNSTEAINCSVGSREEGNPHHQIQPSILNACW